MHLNASNHSAAAKIRAAVIIQKWYRRFKARLELRRRTAWVIHRSIDHATDASVARLLQSAFRDMMQLSAAKDGAAQSILASKTPKKLFYERLTLYGDKSDHDLASTSESGAGFSDIVVEKNYDGVHLKFPLDANQVIKLIEHIKAGNKKLHIKYLLELMHEARLVLKTKPNINQVSTSISKQVTVVGGLFGSVRDMLTIFHKNGLPDVTNPYVFNGGYTNLAPHDIQLVALLCACLLVWPSAVFINRGSHEDPHINSQLGLHKRIATEYPKYSKRLINLYNDLFSWMPLGAVIDSRILVVHGGICDKMDLNHVHKIERHKFISPIELWLNLQPKGKIDRQEVLLVRALLWNDPQGVSRKTEMTEVSGVFEPRVTEDFLKRHNLSLIVRSRNNFLEGYDFFHKRQVLAMFSGSEGPKKGVYVKFDDKGEPHIVQFMTTPSSLNSMRRQVSAVEESALRALREKIAGSKTELLKAFEKMDSTRTGMITPVSWCMAMNSTLHLDLPWVTLLKHLATVEKGKVNYKSTLNQSTLENNRFDFSTVTEILYTDKNQLEAAFRIMDKEGVGHVSHDVFKECCRLVLMFMGRPALTDQQLTDMAKAVDLNNDGNIDYNEFLESFRIVDNRRDIR